MTRQSTRRAFIKAAGRIAVSAGISSLLGSCSGLKPKTAKGNKQPHIVFLLSDDHRYDAMGCAGNKQMKTPNLDRLAAKGMVFERYYNTAAICMASRATIMTGMFEYKTGCNFMHGPLEKEKFEKSYPVLLRQAGYKTGFAGKWGFRVVSGNKDVAWHEYFDSWGGFEGSGQGKYETAKNPSLAKYAQEYPHVSKALGAFGRDFVREYANKDNPFCLSISFKAPHNPRTPDPEYDDLYKDVVFSKPNNWGPKGSMHLPAQAKSGRQYRQRGQWYPDDNYQKNISLYYRLIFGMDVAVGMILDELERQGVVDNTVVIYTSDNGYFCGSHNFQGKVLPYEESALAPMIVYDPRSANMGKGQRVHSITANIDIAPTLLSLAGAAVPKNMDGKNILGMLDRPGSKVRESLPLIQAWPHTESCQALSVVSDNHKYIYWFYGDETSEPAEELYNLNDDKLEMVNLAADPESLPVLEKMRRLYDGHLKHWKDHCIGRDDYQRYIQLYDRDIPWSQKTFRQMDTRR
jgi:arylsulfatase A-like enzyme